MKLIDGKAISTEIKNELKEIFHVDDIYLSELSLSIACHIGPGALAIASCQKMDYDNV